MDDIYNIFKHDFYPGEVAIANINEQRVKVAIREKAKFNAITLPNGEIRPAYCKCRVELLSSPDQEAFVDESELMRDRKYFTKVILKTFIKYSVHRDSWAGAPWLVKDEYAKMHRIDQTIPVHLQRHKGQPSPEDLKQQRQEKREQLKQEKIRLKQERLQETKRLKQEAKQQKLDQILENQRNKLQTQKELQKNKKTRSENFLKITQSMKGDFQQKLQVKSTRLSLDNQKGYINESGNEIYENESITPTKRENVITFDSRAGTPLVFENSPGPNFNNSFFSKLDRHITQEDLSFQYDPIRNSQKPQLKQEEKLKPAYLINAALETWLFLNMYSDPLILDTFTFDDYLDVLYYNDASTECPLLNEIFCSLLSTFIGSESTELLVQFPDPPPDSISDNDENEYSDSEINQGDDSQKKGEPENEDEKKINMETNNESKANSLKQNIKKLDTKELENSLSSEKIKDRKIDIINEQHKEVTNDNHADDKRDTTQGEFNIDYDIIKKIKVEQNDSTESEEPETNRADAYSRFKSTSWEERLKRRMFKDGGWQIILIGLLNSVSYVPEWENSITHILNFMAPLEKPVTLNTALNSFMTMSVELRLKTIQILCELLHGSNLVRNFIDQCLEESARIRRERLENLREYKGLLETLKSLEDQKKHYFPNGFPKVVAHNNVSNPLIQVGALPQENSEDESDDEQKYQLFSVGGKRPASSITRQRKKRKNDAEVALAKSNVEFRKLYQQCEITVTKIEELLDANREVELELVKLDTQRAKMLGKDRYHNRYWWLEGNGIRKSSDEEKKKELKKLDLKKSKVKKPITSNSVSRNSPQKMKGYDESQSDDDSDSDLGYLMGRIWVQGPTESEAHGYLKIDSTTLLPKLYKDNKGQIILDRKEIKPHASNKDVNNPTGIRILVNSSGIVCSDLSIAERKSLEEGNVMLRNHIEWGYYDDPEDVEALLKWLNPFGIREFRLAKEIMNLKSEIIDSMRARKEDLTNDFLEQEKELKEVLEDDEDIAEIDLKILQTRKALKILESDNITETQIKEIDNVLQNVIQHNKVSENIPQARRKSTRLTTDSSSGSSQKNRGSFEYASIGGKHRPARGSSRRATIASDEDEEKNGDGDQFENSHYIGVSSRIAKVLGTKKSWLSESLEKLDQERSKTIQDYKKELAQGRALGWENGRAIEKLGHTLYESQKKRNTRGNSGKRK